jgi:AraC family transcriptional regulator of arabinose operon
MDRRIEICISKIESDPASCELSALAELVDLSPSRFRHLFKEETGLTPSRYLKLVRYRKAAVLLRTTFISIKAILLGVGLNSDSHFVRDFRQIYGMSPTEYRTAKRSNK